MGILIAIITIGLIGFITYKMVEAGRKKDDAPKGKSGNDGVYREPKEEDGTPLPKDPKIKE